MSINYAEDTEFNAALRAHGIIPDLRPKKDSTPSPEVQPEREPELDELSDLEDELPSSVLEAYRSKRMAEARVADQRRQHGEIKHISRPDYTREVTEASKVDLPGEPEGSGTGVICYLFKDYLPDCKTLGPMLVRLAQWYPSSKFVSIVSDHCIPNYPDRNVPTLLCYRKGEMTGQVIGLDGFKGDIHNLEKLLFALRAIDFELKDHEAAKTAKPSASAKAATAAAAAAAADDDSDDDRPSKIRQTDRDDDDFDL